MCELLTTNPSPLLLKTFDVCVVPNAKSDGEMPLSKICRAKESCQLVINYRYNVYLVLI